MNLAKTMRDRVAEHEGASLEYRRGGYRLDVNPITDRPTEVGFIVWRETADGLTPIVAGRTAAGDIVLDGDEGRGMNENDLETVLSTLLAGDLIRVEGSYRDQASIPTASNPGAMSRNG